MSAEKNYLFPRSNKTKRRQGVFKFIFHVALWETPIFHANQGNTECRIFPDNHSCFARTILGNVHFRAACVSFWHPKVWSILHRSETVVAVQSLFSSSKTRQLAEGMSTLVWKHAFVVTNSSKRRFHVIPRFAKFGTWLNNWRSSVYTIQHLQPLVLAVLIFCEKIPVVASLDKKLTCKPKVVLCRFCRAFFTVNWTNKLRRNGTQLARER